MNDNYDTSTENDASGDRFQAVSRVNAICWEVKSKIEIQTVAWSIARYVNYTKY